MIETNAIKSGTRARKEAKTKVSTTSAPSPPSTASSKTPGPPLSAPLSSASASNPVRCTGRPPTSASSTTRLAALSACGFSPKADVGSGCG